MKDNKRLSLSGMDIEAILTALPIIQNYPADTPEQEMLNDLCCRSAKIKIMKGKNNFTDNELRVIGLSVCFAAEYLSGNVPELDNIYPNAFELRKYAFVYPRLKNHFQPMFDTL